MLERGAEVQLHETSGQLIGQIESLIRSQKYAEALRGTNLALQERPSDFRIWTLQGIALS